MFQFRRFPTYDYFIHHTLLVYYHQWVAPFGNPRVIRLLSPNRGFSQIAASFFGSQCQGIPLALFVAWPINFLSSEFHYVIHFELQLFVARLNYSCCLLTITLFLNHLIRFIDGCEYHLTLRIRFIFSFCRIVQFSRCVLNPKFIKLWSPNVKV